MLIFFYFPLETREVGRHKPSCGLVLAALTDGVPKSSSEVVEATGPNQGQVYNPLLLCWKRELALRTEKPIHRHQNPFKGSG